MNNGNILSAKILEELNGIHSSVKRAEAAWKKAYDTDDDLYFDSVALNLHSFYSGIEKIFKLIAKEVDENIPDGQNRLTEVLVRLRQSNREILLPFLQTTYNKA